MTRYFSSIEAKNTLIVEINQPKSIGQIKVAVVGAGQLGRNLVRTFADLKVLAVVVDTDLARAEALGKQHGVSVNTFSDILADPQINCLVIATPAISHAFMVRKALLAGKDVFVEKPLALDVSEAEELVDLAKKRGLILMVGHLLQYHPAYLKLCTLVRAGKLGRMNYVYSNRLNLGRVRKEENILWSFAPHDVSMILTLMGEFPESVTTVGSYYLQNSVADVTTTHLRFPSGQNAHIFVSWLHPFKEQKLVVVGDAGMAVFDDQQPWEEKLTIYAHEIRWENDLPVPYKARGEKVVIEAAEPLRVEAEHFISSVCQRTTPRTDGVEGAMVLRVLDAAERSMRQGATVRLMSTEERNIKGVFVHPTAVLDQPINVGAGTKIWHYTHILADSRIGKNCTIGQNVMIGPDVTIGDACKIQNNVSIYKGTHLEDEVFCGPSCVFTNVLNPRAAISRKNEIKLTIVRKGATIGANATIICGIELGEHCFVGAGAVVTKDVPAFALVLGTPARRVGWVSHEGERLNKELVCPRSGRQYAEVGQDKLREISQ